MYNGLGLMFGIKIWFKITEKKINSFIMRLDRPGL